VRHQRHYTLDEARAQLPWVMEQLALLRSARGRMSGSGESPQQEVAPVNGGGTRAKQVGEAALELEAGVAALAGRDIVLRDLDRGLIDFPSIRQGKEIYLCWVDGEEDIHFWHDLDAGYAGRQPL
jgi:hypothetical protein